LITVTEEAMLLLSAFDMSTLDLAEGAVLRLDPVTYDEVTGEITLGEGKGDDQIVQHGGEQVLRIAGAVSQRLNGSTMDVVVEAQPEGTRMGIVPPDSEPLMDDS
jgi:iron-sulfur cluster assembly protein